MTNSDYWTRWGRRRFTRRATLASAGVAGLGGAALALVGCGGGSNKSTSTTSGATGVAPAAGAAPPSVTSKALANMSLDQIRTTFTGASFKNLQGFKNGPVNGGTMRWASRTPITWDITGPSGSVLSSYQFAHNQLLQFKVNDAVTDPNFMEIEPVLASAMPEQPDDMTYIFHLRQGVKFQDVPPVNGREFTADDVVYCIQAYQKAPVQGPTYKDVASVQKIDNYTVKITMSTPAAYFLNSTVTPTHWMFAREQKESPDGLAKIPIGTGGFLFDSSVNLAGFKFKKNPNYFRKDPVFQKQLPYIDGIECSYFPDPAQAIAAFRSNQIDVLYPQNRDDWTSVVESNPESLSQITTPPPSYQPFVAMRLDKAPFNDPRVRRALSMLIDRDAIIKSLAGGLAGYGYGQDWTYFGSEWPFEQSKLGQYATFNPTAAKQLLSAAGVSNLNLNFLMSSFAGFNFEVYSAVSGMLNAGGIQTIIDAPQDSSTWQKQYFGASFADLCGVGFVGPGWDPDTFSYQAMYSKSTNNYFHINDPQVDALCVKERTTLEPTARKQALTDLMNYDLDQVTRLWTVAPYKINMRKPNVYSIIDTEAAWSTLGWGSAGVDMSWKTA